MSEIQETPGVSGGYPCIGDTRVRVGLVIEALEDVAERYDLELTDIAAALNYYNASVENRRRVNEDIARDRMTQGEEAVMARRGGYG